MKKHFLLIVSFITILYGISSSCSKDKITQKNNVICTAADSALTYNSAIKAIFDSHCATVGCHTSSAAAASVILDNYNSCMIAVKDKNVLCAMKYESGCTPMPPAGKLNDSIIHKISCWQQGGFLN